MIPGGALTIGMREGLQGAGAHAHVCDRQER